MRRYPSIEECGDVEPEEKSKGSVTSLRNASDYQLVHSHTEWAMPSGVQAMENEESENTPRQLILRRT